MAPQSVRQQIASGRRRLHQEAAVAAYYVTEDTSGMPVSVRLHQRIRAVGDGLGGRSTIFDTLPRILFQAELIAPEADSYVFFPENNQLFFVKNVLPSDGIIVTAEAVFVAESERSGLDMAVTIADLVTLRASDCPGKYRYLLDGNKPGLIVSTGTNWVRLADSSVVEIPNPAVTYVRVDGTGRVRITGLDVIRTAGVS